MMMLVWDSHKIRPLTTRGVLTCPRSDLGGRLGARLAVPNLAKVSLAITGAPHYSVRNGRGATELIGRRLERHHMSRVCLSLPE